MDLKATIPLSAVLAYIAFHGACKVLLRAFGLTVGVAWTDWIVILATGGLVIMLFVGFVSPVVFQRHLDRVEAARKHGSPSQHGENTGIRSLRRVAASLALLSLVCAGFWLSMFVAPLESKAFTALPGSAEHRTWSSALHYGGLILIGGGLSGVMITWAFRLPDVPAPEPVHMPYNGGLTEAEAQLLVGREGLVQAALRPQGNLKLDGRTYVVKSEVHFVDEGTAVRVDRIDGPNIVVVPVREEG